MRERWRKGERKREIERRREGEREKKRWDWWVRTDVGGWLTLYFLRSTIRTRGCRGLFLLFTKTWFILQKLVLIIREKIN